MEISDKDLGKIIATLNLYDKGKLKAKETLREIRILLAISQSEEK